MFAFIASLFITAPQPKIVNPEINQEIYCLEYECEEEEVKFVNLKEIMAE